MDYYEEYLVTGDQKYLDAYLGTIRPPRELVAADMRTKLAGTAAPEPAQELGWVMAFGIAFMFMAVFIVIVALNVTVGHNAAHPRPAVFPALRCPTTISLAVNPPLTSYNHWILGDHRKPATLPEVTEMRAAIQNALDSCH